MVVSVEDNEDWYFRIKENQPANLAYYLVKDKRKYVDFIRTQETDFHVIAVDGSHREDCITTCFDHLTPDGVLIVDNSEMDYLSSSIEFLMSKGLKQLEFYGLGPCNGYPWGTSIFYRDNNLFHIS